MEAKELRIGNLVSYQNQNLKIYSIDATATLSESWVMYFYVLSDGIMEKPIHTDSTKLLPILLTDEWILSLGFENSGDFFILNDIRIYKFHPKFESDTYIFDFGMSNSYLELDYVHELQNLYFTLTGEELQRE